MKKYLAFDGINGGHEDFDTIEEARKWLEDCFLSPDEGYHPDFASCKIYQLAETVECEVVDKKENYKYIYEDDIPEGDNESQAWPYSTDFDEIWKHKFVSETDQKIADKMVEERIILDEEMAEPVQDALYATGRFTIDECNVLTEGILMYIKERGIINLKSRESHG